MLIAHRNGMVAAPYLKPFKCELEYLESTGTQWIDTGVVVTDPSTVSVSVTRVSGNFNFGLTHANVAAGTWLGVRTSAFNKAYFKNYATTVDVPNTWQRLRWDGSSGLYADGALVGAKSASVGTDVIGSTSWPIFAMHEFNGGGVSQYSAGQISSVQIVVSGVLVRDLIPVLDWDGSAKMFDRVTQSYPAHYGTFVAGPEIWPVEYISAANNTSSTYKYINTGVTPALNTKWELRAAFTRPASVGSSYIGLYGGSNGQFDIGKSLEGVWIFNRGATTTGGAVDENWHTFLLDGPNGVGYVDGVATVTLGSSFAYGSTGLAKGTICLFCRGRGDRTPPIDINGASSSFVDMSIASSRIWDENGNLVRDYKAIRVGSGTTWEGALLDTVERKVYRNAGTGAFAYGNDVNN